MLTSVAVFLRPGSATQIVAGMVVRDAAV